MIQSETCFQSKSFLPRIDLDLKFDFDKSELRLISIENLVRMIVQL